jgi:hypothetical protein
MLLFGKLQIIDVKISRFVVVRQGVSIFQNNRTLECACDQDLVNNSNERTWHALIDWQVHMRPDERQSNCHRDLARSGDGDEAETRRSEPMALPEKK